MQETKTRPLKIALIGYGNTLRRDDGAGRHLAEKITHTWQNIGQHAHLILTTHLLPELAASLADEQIEVVIFVDTCVVDANVAPHAERIGMTKIVTESDTASLGHQLAPAALLTYLALLYQQRPQAWLVTVPGHDFAHGEGFSPSVEQLLQDTTPFAFELLAALKEALLCMN